MFNSPEASAIKDNKGAQAAILVHFHHRHNQLFPFNHMDPIATSVVLCITTFEWIVTLLLHSFVIHIVAYKTPKEHQNFSTLILIQSVLAIFSATIAWATVNRAGPETKNRIVHVNFGACSLLGPRICSIMDQFTIMIVCYFMILIPATMLYRLYVFYNSAARKRNVVAAFGSLFAPWIYFLVYGIQQYIPAEQLDLHHEEILSFHGHPYYALRMEPCWQTTTIHIFTYLPLFCCGSTIIIRFFVLSKIKSSNFLSPQAKQLQRSFAKMLLLQAYCPLIVTVAATFTTIVDNFADAPAVLGSLSYALMGLTPIIDALAVLFLVPHHKAILIRYFGSNKTQPLFTTTASIPWNPHYSTHNSYN